MDKHRLLLSVAVYAGWLAIMFWGAWEPHSPTNPAAVISSGIVIQIVIACAFLIAMLLIFRWRDVGLDRPRPWQSLWVLAGPSIYLLLFAVGIAFVGLPPTSAVIFLAINTLLVGFSEEMMFRGVLFGGLRSRLSLWPAVWLTSAIFGITHVLNALMTGELVAASVQAITAFMSGSYFLALRLRTKSIVPSMLFHAGWDFLLTLFATAALAAAATSPDTSAAAVQHVDLNAALLIPLVLELPLFVYAVFILRRVARDERKAVAQAREMPALEAPVLAD